MKEELELVEVPEDVQGKCNARLLIGSNHGEDHTSIVCQRRAGHKGKHSETWDVPAGKVAIHWTGDERKYEDAEAFVLPKE